MALSVIQSEAAEGCVYKEHPFVSCRPEDATLTSHTYLLN